MNARLENAVSRADRTHRLTGRIPEPHPNPSAGHARTTAGSALEDGKTRAAMQSALYRATSWRVPPNWSALDWLDELGAIASASACQAESEYDSTRGVPRAAFVYLRVRARALARYRQEWRYALHLAPATAEAAAEVAAADQLPRRVKAAFESVDRTLAQLPEMERWLLDQIFWQRRTETSIAAELHLSQAAICKRKRAALLHSRTLLAGRESGVKPASLHIGGNNYDPSRQ
jgi:DNA-directed RNA polymerase specialized sigma24 family protein